MARRSVKGRVEEKEAARVHGEGENKVRKGKGVDAVLRRGRSGEGENNVRVEQVVVRVQGVGGNTKEARTEREVGNSPVLTKVEEGRPRVGKMEDVIYLNVDEEGRTTRVTEEEMDQLVLLEYKSDPVDREWAGSGVVATVVTGETILSIQHRVEDAGFVDLEVISMGGDKVFLRCRSNDDIWKVFNDVVDFFRMFLSNVHKWSYEDLRYERGAWLRVYGTPTHAWNTNFFKLCVSKCGKFVQADECTSDRGRIDYARILISTTSLQVLNTTTIVLVDG